MKNTFIFLAIIICSPRSVAKDIENASCNFQAGPLFYYSGKKKIYIRNIEGSPLLTIGFKNDTNSVQTQSSLSAIKTLLPVSDVKWQNEHRATLQIGGLGLSNDVLSNKQALVERDVNIKYINPVYYPIDLHEKVNDKAALLLTDEILVKFKRPLSALSLNQFISRYELSIVKRTLDFDIFSVPKRKDAITVANLLQETEPNIEYAQPNFIINLKKNQAAQTSYTPSDPYFVNQFYLHNTGQTFNGNACTKGADISIMGAWAVTRGNPNIIIAVIDEGITANHPDLPDSRQIRLPKSNFVPGENPDDPSPRGNANHGNACAGIIGASHNGEGIAGIAPDCKIMPVKIPIDFDDASIDQIAGAINFAWRNHADVISCSWGSEAFTDPNQFIAITGAIQSAVDSGRSRKGCIVVFSAGNSAVHDIDIAGTIFFPDNVEIADVLTIGASDRNNKQSNYSPTAQSENNQKIDLVATSSKVISPTNLGEVWTIDIPGDSGDNPDKNFHDSSPDAGNNYLAYMSRFRGTSASCPMVAGVAALILSVKPKLTKHDVYNILTESADTVGAYQYTAKKCRELGFGKLNATAALQSTISYRSH